MDGVHEMVCLRRLLDIALVARGCHCIDTGRRILSRAWRNGPAACACPVAAAMARSTAQVGQPGVKGSYGCGSDGDQLFQCLPLRLRWNVKQNPFNSILVKTYKCKIK
jgi:hypothetical protein